MNDLEMVKLCAEAIGYESHSIYGPPINIGQAATSYNPLHDDAQAMELVKKFGINIWSGPGSWRVMGGTTGDEGDTWNADLNRAIVECVAKLQQAKTPA